MSKKTKKSNQKKPAREAKTKRARKSPDDAIAKPILIIQHAEFEHPAALRRALQSQGLGTYWLHPYRGEAYPESHEIAGIISLGGPMGANDEEEFPWIRQEISLMQRVFDRELPMVGICLGGQMMARALGGRVERNPLVEVGWFPIELNEVGQEDPIVGAAGANPTVYHWHGDTFYPPKEATHLGRSMACERQVYRINDKTYGFQFHPEADHQLVLEWLEIDGVADELLLVQKNYGSQTVQDAVTQRNHALKGEKGSLKITAAIGSLFRQKQDRKISKALRDRVLSWATHRTEVFLDFHDWQDPKGARRSKKVSRLRGRISTLLTIPSGEYVIFEEEPSTLLWPIRLGDILKLSPA
jgi:GMP synthase-like glutamine amidotransferase